MALPICELVGAAHLHVDGQHGGHLLLRGVFVRHGPARLARGKAQLALLRERKLGRTIGSPTANIHLPPHRYALLCIASLSCGPLYSFFSFSKAAMTAL